MFGFSNGLLCVTDVLKERLARLIGGVGVLQIGGSSEVEVGEKKVMLRLFDPLPSSPCSFD